MKIATLQSVPATRVKIAASVKMRYSVTCNVALLIFTEESVKR